MAGNIPPLVSSTPPPLNAFDDEEEEEEDDFGLYNTAEDIEYNDCLSFKVKDDEKQNVPKSRGEQDSTSQDSATDSGLCPDSDGMSPIPHSDEEKTLKQNSCDKQCQNTSEQPQSCVGELGDCQATTASVNHETASFPNLPNGHAKEDHCSHESDDDFGNFEFAPSHKVQTTVEENFGEGGFRSLSPSNVLQFNEGELNGGSVLHNKQFSEVENEEEVFSEFCLSESNSKAGDNTNNNLAVKKSCENEENITEYNGFATEKLNIDSSTDSSSFNSVDSSSETKGANHSQCSKIEQHDMDSKEKVGREAHEDGLKPTMENFDYREEKEINIPDECDDDDEFDDFTDFKAEFPGCDKLSRSESVDEFNKHSKIPEEQTKLGDAALSSPNIQDQDECDDEFSNFADFSSSDCAFVSAQSSNSLENVSHMPLKLDESDLRTESEFQDWVSVFPCEDTETPLVATALLRQDDVVWSRLFPLESSPALSYQWNESLANRRLLTALNIDSRNILFTPWSISAVPRFAANLSCGPLEPTKATEPLQPTTAPPTTTVPPAAPPTATTQESVPDAHFDWASAGLTNPLDSCHSSLLDLNFIMTIETHLAVSPKTVLNLPKILSAEAESILNSLPDISFMRKTYIDFPIEQSCGEALEDIETTTIVHIRRFHLQLDTKINGLRSVVSAVVCDIPTQGSLSIY